jgi:hypothetical protein
VALRKWQKNEVFDAVQEAGLSPEEFDWDLGDDESTLRHRPSGAYFVFRGVAGAYVTRYVAGDSPAEERTGLSQYRLMEQVKLWLYARRPAASAVTDRPGFRTRDELIGRYAEAQQLA